MEFNLTKKEILIMREIRLRGEGYSSQIRKRIFEHFGVSFWQGPFSGTLQKLERDGFLVSDPRVENLEVLKGYPRYYYNLTGKGRHVPLPADEQERDVVPLKGGLVLALSDCPA